MKIAVLSDIHANKEALKEVLKSVEKFNPDMIFCLGDLILAGYDPNGTMEIIFDLMEKYGENFKIIQGNTDKMVATATENMIKKVQEAFPCMGFSLENDIKITDKKYIDFVKNLDEKLDLTINNLKIELVHGSPREQDENIFPSLEEKVVEEMTNNSKAELILCGHTHIPCGYSLNNGKTIVNVGSVGRSMTADKMPIYLELTIDKNGKYFVEHKKVKYDNKKVVNYILSRNFKHCEDLAKMYVEE